MFLLWVVLETVLFIRFANLHTLSPAELAALPPAHTQAAGAERSPSPQQLHCTSLLQVLAAAAGILSQTHRPATCSNCCSRWESPRHNKGFLQATVPFGNRINFCLKGILGQWQLRRHLLLQVPFRHTLLDSRGLGRPNGIEREGKGVDEKARGKDFSQKGLLTCLPLARLPVLSGVWALPCSWAAREEPARCDETFGAPWANQARISIYCWNRVSSTWFRVSAWTVYTTPGSTGKLTWLLQEHSLARCNSGTSARKACREGIHEHFTCGKKTWFLLVHIAVQTGSSELYGFPMLWTGKPSLKNPKNYIHRFSLRPMKCSRLATWLRFKNLLKSLWKSNMVHRYALNILAFSEILSWKHFLFYFQNKLYTF